MMYPKVAIITVNYNRLTDTMACIASLRRMTYPNFEVLVVDNNSTDESVLELQNVNDIKLIRSSSNVGFTGGNNLGIQFALDSGSDFVLLLNNDTIVSPGFLDELMIRATMLPKLGLCTCRINSSNDNVWYGGGHLRKCYGSVRVLKNDRVKEVCEVTHIDGCMMLIKRDVLERVGFLDKRYFMYFEDAQFCYRVRQAGYKLYYVPHVSIYHNVNGDGNRFFSAYFTLRNRQLFIKEQLNNAWLPRFIFYAANFFKITVFFMLRNKLYKSIYYAICDFRKGKTGNTYNKALLG